MNIFGFTALTGLILAGALTGCSMSNYDDEPSSGANSSMDYVPAQADFTQHYMVNTALGPVMATPSGLTVYTFDLDRNGQSNCYGTCAKNWPPVLASSDAKPQGRMSLVSRDDGQRQWTYDGLPLYTYADDSKPGDVNGNNVGNVWHVVQ